MEEAYEELIKEIEKEVDRSVRRFFDEIEAELRECKNCKLFTSWEDRRRCVLIRKLYKWIVSAIYQGFKIVRELKNRGLEKERVDAVVLLGILGEAFHGAFPNEIVIRQITGRSMEPTLEPGDIVCTLIGNQLSIEGICIEKGDIVRYVLPLPAIIGLFINKNDRTTGFLHRVKDIFKSGNEVFFRFKGDACQNSDPWEVPEAFITRKVTKIIKKGDPAWRVLNDLIQKVFRRE